MQVKSCVTLFLELILMLQERLRDNSLTKGTMTNCARSVKNMFFT